MYKVVIFGVSPDSIGSFIARHLRSLRHDVTAYRRVSHRPADRCDVTNVAQVQRELQRIRPDVVVHAAGPTLQASAWGSTVGWSTQMENALTKAFGGIVALDTCVRVGCVQKFIAVGGRLVSAHPTFGGYSVGNCALWGAVQHANKHAKRLHAYYLNLPTVAESGALKKLIANGSLPPDAAQHAIPVDVVLQTVEEILNGERSRGEVLVGDHWLV